MEKIFIPPIKRAKNWGWVYTLKDINSFWRIVDKKGQGFNGNGVPACKFIETAPCDKSIYQYFGKKSHGAEDVPCPHKEPILNSADGKVIHIDTDRATGLGIVVFHPQYNLKTIHWHFDSLDVVLGQNVKQGELLGLADSTGYSMGTHDHWAVKRTGNKGNTINKDNGWNGAIPFRHLVGWHDMAKLTKDQVRKFYVLTRKDFTDKVLDFWAGKELNELQDAMIKDDLRRLEEEINK